MRLCDNLSMYTDRDQLNQHAAVILNFTIAQRRTLVLMEALRNRTEGVMSVMSSDICPKPVIIGNVGNAVSRFIFQERRIVYKVRGTIF